MLVGLRAVEDAGSDAEFFALTVTAIADDLEGRWFRPDIVNPSLSSEDLMRTWKGQTYEGFVKKLRTLANLSQRALTAEDTAGARRCWQKAFGARF